MVRISINIEDNVAQIIKKQFFDDNSYFNGKSAGFIIDQALYLNYSINEIPIQSLHIETLSEQETN